ncbi:MAG: hypothetical protein NTX05_02525 [Fusobacteria bacterium]|nr:hypothetical protein [Fusobacteriota bacterium]
MIDIHNHIIFDVDDGAKTLDESINMITMAKREGINAIIATSHFIPGRFDKSQEVHKEKLEIISKELEKRGEKIPLFLGREILFHSSFFKNYEILRTLTLASSRYLLVEFFHHEIPNNFSEFIYELKIRGLVPIIAHAERFIHSEKDFKKIAKLYLEGALIQVTINSIIGTFGPDARIWMEKLLELNMVQFLASDAHKESGKRSYEVTKALVAINKLISSEKVELLTKINPQKILSNEVVKKEELNVLLLDGEKKRKRLFGIL